MHHKETSVPSGFQKYHQDMRYVYGSKRMGVYVQVATFVICSKDGQYGAKLKWLMRCCPCKAGNKNCNANCQCRWRSSNEVTKLKIIKRLAVRYFSIFLFEIQKIFIRKCSTFIYNPQALPGSLKFRTWCFSLTLYIEYEAIQRLDT